MINIKIAEFFIGIITFLIAYLMAVTPANFFRAWVAKKVGDPTAENMGFLTLNPLVHIDPIGISFLFFSYFIWHEYFGWGRYIPINPLNITHPLRTIKLIAAYFSDTMAHFFLALSGLVVLIATFDSRIINVSRYMILTRKVSHLSIAHLYPEVSSFIVSIAFIIFAFIYLNVILGVLDFIINACSLVMFFVVDRSSNHSMHDTITAMPLRFLLLIILIIFFAEPFRFLAVNFISYAGYTIAHALRLI